MAADSFSACLSAASGVSSGIRRGTSCRMMLGIIWKVEALPTTVMKNMKMHMLKKHHQLAAWIKYLTPHTPSILIPNTQKETRAHPHLSAPTPLPAGPNAPPTGPTTEQN